MIYGVENGTSWYHLAVCLVDVAFACYFVAPYHPPPSTPKEVLVVMAMLVTNEKLSKMVGNSASIHSTVGTKIDYVMNSYGIVVNLHGIIWICFPFQDTILQIIKISISKVYNCAWKLAFLLSSHNYICTTYICSYIIVFIILISTPSSYNEERKTSSINHIAMYIITYILLVHA